MDRPDPSDGSAAAPTAGRTSGTGRVVTTGRGLAVAVLACAVGAALVVWAAGQTWSAEVVPRQPPLPDLRTDRSGGQLRPLLPALGWVALAGVPALLALRAVARRALGGLLAVAGLVMAGLAVTGSAAAGTGVGGGSVGWPVLAGLGGLLVTAGGGLALRYGGRWPGLGARYQRADRRSTGADPDRPEQLWEALDRGEDPTA